MFICLATCLPEVPVQCFAIAGRPVKKLVLLILFSGVFSTASAEWNSYLGIDKKSNVKEGFAFSNWTIVSPSLNSPDEKIEAALVAGCNETGEKSLYVRMLPNYQATGAVQGVALVRGQIQWDSSNSYDVPFTYDAGLNALQLRAGIEDSLSLINDGNKVTIQVPWHDGREVVFEFSLSGSSKALKTAFAHCLVDL